MRYIQLRIKNSPHTENLPNHQSRKEKTAAGSPPGPPDPAQLETTEA